jgi:histidine triad (HIT) family protein
MLRKIHRLTSFSILFTTQQSLKVAGFQSPFVEYSKFRGLRSVSDSGMSDEVKAAKKAAEEYQLSSADGAGPATVFDKLLSNEWECKKVYEDDQALAFADINPQAPVHILIIPKNRDGLTQLSKAREDQKALLGHLMYVAAEVGKKECPNGFRIVINDGEQGAQSVYHLHLHLLGGRQMEWPPG